MSRCSSRLLAWAVGIFMFILQNKRVCPHYYLLISLSWSTSSVIHSSRWLAFIHSFLWWVFHLSSLPHSSSWVGYHLAIIHSGCWVVHLSFIHTLIIHQLVYISFAHSFIRVCLICLSVCPFVHSFVRPLASDSFVDIVHELFDVEWYRGGNWW